MTIHHRHPLRRKKRHTAYHSPASYVRRAPAHALERIDHPWTQNNDSSRSIMNS
ncbi:hypothetical protein BALAC2494_02035 [Bifidobacterium animalis subsp. lactis CNCM I-2494]|uniref:Uncharacterized protein n=1 Tax=Bifidobacterium animalis subsp. lactis CNCM I-2494 TaxID=1042403 RepID=A0A806FMF0_BIFAN|nr:hypothetical protein BALAC2494_02035 [Bifidobacterium animalis subsp. lactis CNCM I-2494]